MHSRTVVTKLLYDLLSFFLHALHISMWIKEAFLLVDFTEVVFYVHRESQVPTAVLDS